MPQQWSKPVSSGLPPIPRIRKPDSQFAGLVITGPCPVCRFVVTLDFKTVRKQLGSKKVYMKRYYGWCPNHFGFSYTWQELSAAWQNA